VKAARPSSESETMQVVVAERVARLVVAGCGLCEESGVPLTERQKVAFLTAIVLELDGMRDELAGLRRVERLLAELGGGNGHPSSYDDD
jgi:hypothetical protein